MRERATAALQNIYLTLVSFICSLAFGYLLSTLELDLLFGRSPDPVYWLKVIGTLQIILIIWNEYASNTILLRWVVDYVDSVIPFLYGVALFAVITVLPGSTAGWLIAMGAFSLLGTGGYINQYVKARGEPENHAALDLAGFHRIVITFTIGATVLLFGTGAWLSTTTPGGAPELGVLIVVNVLLASLPVITHFLRRDALRVDPRSEGPRV